MRAAGLAAAVDLVLVLAGAPEWMRIPFGLLTVLVLPGYVWQTVFRSHDRTPLRGLLMTVMASVGIAIVTGLLLNAVPGGLTARSWAVALTIIVELGVAADWATRRQKAPPDTPAVRTVLRPATALKILAAAGCVVTAAAISLSSQHTLNASEHFATLSLAGINSRSPVVTVANHQGRRASYQLSVFTNGKLRGTERIALDAGSHISKNLKDYVQSTSPTSLIRVTLRVPGSSTIYRDVWFETAS